MRKLFRFALTLAIGVTFGYVFNNVIDAKLKTKYGEERVEKFKAGVKFSTEKGIDVGVAMKEAAEKEISE